MVYRRDPGASSYHGYTSGGSDPDDGLVWLDRWIVGPVAVTRMRGLKVGAGHGRP